MVSENGCKDWSSWQLIDSFLPTGGFAQSYGLEAAVQSGLVRNTEDLRHFLFSSLENVGSLFLPFVSASHSLSFPNGSVNSEIFATQYSELDHIEKIVNDWHQLDITLNAMLSNHVANQASVTQGSALLRISINLFPESSFLREIRTLIRSHSSKSSQIRNIKTHSSSLQNSNFKPETSQTVLSNFNTSLKDSNGQRSVLEPNQVTSTLNNSSHSSNSMKDSSSPNEGTKVNKLLKAIKHNNASNSSYGHHAPLFGLLCGIMKIEKLNSQRIYLYTSMRDILSAATRLNLIGPLEASKVQYSLGDVAESILLRHANLDVRDAFQSCPLFDVVQGGHDLLFSRLFCG